jgi:hypothetical protein
MCEEAEEGMSWEYTQCPRGLLVIAPSHYHEPGSVIDPKEWEKTVLVKWQISRLISILRRRMELFL